MVSIIITTKDPEKTFKKSFEATYLAAQILQAKIPSLEVEIVIVTPIKYSFLNNISTGHLPVAILEDEKKGKPAALNIAVLHATGDYLIFTDGDVLCERTSFYELYTYTLEQNLVIAGGKPISLESKKTMLGYWSWVLVDGNASKIRHQFEQKRKKNIRKFFPVSGYLFILKRELFESIDPQTLADDAYISYITFKKGYAIGYAENSFVYIKYPTTYRDYLAQKLRSTGGYQVGSIKKSKVRSFSFEAVKGTIQTLTYAHTVKEFFWSLLLLLSRLHLWALIIYYVKYKKRADLWVVIPTSKNI